LQAHAAFDVRFDGHSVMSCTLKDEAMAKSLKSAVEDQELDLWSHDIKVVRPQTLPSPSNTAAHLWCFLRREFRASLGF
jgi:hypothetical protein